MTPFKPSAWPAAQRAAAQSLWDFYHALATPAADVPVEEEVRRCKAGKQLRIIAPQVARRAYAACEQHDLDAAFLADMVQAAASMVPPVRFATTKDLLAFVRLRCGAHARLLSQLAGQRGRFRTRGIQEYAKALFLTKRLCCLPQDLERDRLFLPLTDLKQFGVSVEQFQRGGLDERVRRLLWKQAVRIRDAYGASQRLGLDLTGWARRQFRRDWMEGLYLLSVVEKRKFDVWTKPVTLSGARRMQMRWQILVGKTSFR